MDFNRLTEKSQDAHPAGATHGRELRQPAGGCRAPAAGHAGTGGRSCAIDSACGPMLPLEPLHRRLVQEIEKLPKVSGGAVRPDQLYITSRLSPSVYGCRGTSQAAEGRVRFDRAPAAGGSGGPGSGGAHAAGIWPDSGPADEGAGRGPWKSAGDDAESRRRPTKRCRNTAGI